MSTRSELLVLAIGSPEKKEPEGGPQDNQQQAAGGQDSDLVLQPPPGVHPNACGRLQAHLEEGSLSWSIRQCMVRQQRLHLQVKHGGDSIRLCRCFSAGGKSHQILKDPLTGSAGGLPPERRLIFQLEDDRKHAAEVSQKGSGTRN